MGIQQTILGVAILGATAVATLADKVDGEGFLYVVGLVLAYAGGAVVNSVKPKK